MTERAKQLLQGLADLPETTPLPVLFVGHGSPMNAVEENTYTQAWGALGSTLPRPAAILVISAHWLADQTEVDVSERPPTIHDFYGFPEQLYKMTYRAPGAPALAREVGKMLMPKIHPKETLRGLDHGAWVVLRRMYEKADIPTFQLAIDYPKAGEYHYELGAMLAPLRKRGVLILGSGNIVHNLPKVIWSPDGKAKPYDWAVEFDEKAKALIEKGDHASLMKYEGVSTGAQLAVPTPDHYWPFLYALGAAGADASPSFPVTGIEMGSVSMRTVMWK